MPEPRRPLLDPLRELDAELGRTRLSAEADARLRELCTGATRPAGWRALGLPVGAALAAAAAALLLLWPKRPEAPPSPPRVGGFALLAGRTTVESSGGGVRCGSDRCSLAAEDLGTELVLERATTVERRPGSSIRLRSGVAGFWVRKRPPGAAPVRILVSHGAIEVLGTRFQLWQEEKGGRVELEVGRLRFRAEDGRQLLLSPGERLAWPLPRPSSVDGGAGSQAALDLHGPRTAGPPRTRDLGPPINTEQAESLLDEVERMRSQGRYREVARRLRDALPRIAEGATRERFSFELGTVLTQQLRDLKRACAHWRRHLDLFGTRRYGPEIRAAQRELGCPR